MRNPTSLPKCGTCLAMAALAALLLISSTTYAATGDDAAPPGIAAGSSGEILELEEIWVRGKKLSHLIEDAENDFFRLYNKINKNNDYDISCADIRLDRDSLALVRTCLPQVLGTYYDVPYFPPVSTSTCVAASMAPYYGAGYDAYHFTGCQESFGSYSRMSASLIPRVILRSGAPATDQMRREYARNVLKVIYRDPRLMEQAITLAGLYEEMKSVQDSYARARADERARKQARRELRMQNSRSPARPVNPRL